MWSSSPLPTSGVYIYILGLAFRERAARALAAAGSVALWSWRSIEFNGRSCFAPNDGETGGPKECGSADDSDAAKGLVVDAVVAVVAAVSIYAVALF